MIWYFLSVLKMSTFILKEARYIVTPAGGSAPFFLSSHFHSFTCSHTSARHFTASTALAVRSISQSLIRHPFRPFCSVGVDNIHMVIMRLCSGLQNWLVPILIIRPVEMIARWSFFMVVLRFIQISPTEWAVINIHVHQIIVLLYVWFSVASKFQNSGFAHKYGCPIIG